MNMVPKIDNDPESRRMQRNMTDTQKRNYEHYKPADHQRLGDLEPSEQRKVDRYFVIDFRSDDTNIHLSASSPPYLGCI